MKHEPLVEPQMVWVYANRTIHPQSSQDGPKHLRTRNPWCCGFRNERCGIRNAMGFLFSNILDHIQSSVGDFVWLSWNQAISGPINGSFHVSRQAERLCTWNYILQYYQSVDFSIFQSNLCGGHDCTCPRNHWLLPRRCICNYCMNKYQRTHFSMKWSFVWTF